MTTFGFGVERGGRFHAGRCQPDRHASVPDSADAIFEDLLQPCVVHDEVAFCLSAYHC